MLKRPSTNTRPTNIRRIKKPATLTYDGFINTLTRTGLGALNPVSYSSYLYQNFTFNYQELLNLYKSHWVVKRIIDVVAGDMLREGYDITSQITPEEENALKNLTRSLRINQKLNEGLCWGRLFGGAGGLIVVKGGEDLSLPLDYDTVELDSFKGILIFDCKNGIYPTGDIIDDIDNIDFGLPEYYNISNDNFHSVKVHHSRIIRFEGRKLPMVERASNNYWGASEIEHIREELAKRDNVSWNISMLTFMANLRVLKLFGLESLQGRANADGISNLQHRIEATNAIMNSNGLLVLGENDEFQSFQYSFAGLGECYDRFMMDISGACEIPVTRLFGRSPAGMNATGESDLTNYYDMIREKQESILRPIYEKLLPIMFLSLFGKVPEDLNFEFNPLESPNDMEKSDLATKKTGNITQVYQAGLISQQTALKELRQMTELTGDFSNITDEEINKAKTEAEQPNEGMAIPEGMPMPDEQEEELPF